jgi:hypothetical protein
MNPTQRAAEQQDRYGRALPRIDESFFPKSTACGRRKVTMQNFLAKCA